MPHLISCKSPTKATSVPPPQRNQFNPLGTTLLYPKETRPECSIRRSAEPESRAKNIPTTQPRYSGSYNLRSNPGYSGLPRPGLIAQNNTTALYSNYASYPNCRRSNSLTYHPFDHNIELHSAAALNSVAPTVYNPMLNPACFYNPDVVTMSTTSPNISFAEHRATLYSQDGQTVSQKTNKPYELSTQQNPKRSYSTKIHQENRIVSENFSKRIVSNDSSRAKPNIKKKSKGDGNSCFTNNVFTPLTQFNNVNHEPSRISNAEMQLPHTSKASLTKTAQSRSADTRYNDYQRRNYGICTNELIRNDIQLPEPNRYGVSEQMLEMSNPIPSSTHSTQHPEVKLYNIPATTEMMLDTTCSMESRLPSFVPRRQISLNELNMAASRSDGGTFLPTSNSTTSNLSSPEVRNNKQRNVTCSSQSACTSPLDGPPPLMLRHRSGVDLSQSLQDYSCYTNFRQTPCQSYRDQTNNHGRTDMAQQSSKLLPPVHFSRTSNATHIKNKAASRQRAKDLYSLVRCREETNMPFSKASSLPIDGECIQRRIEHNAVRPTSLTKPVVDVNNLADDEQSQDTGCATVRDFCQVSVNSNPEGSVLNDESYGSRTARCQRYGNCSLRKNASSNALAVDGFYVPHPQNTNVDFVRGDLSSIPVELLNETSRNIAEETEQLLSSLSKLASDSTGKSAIWHDNYCLSDVESEYAALELMLSFNSPSLCPNETAVPKEVYDSVSKTKPTESERDNQRIKTKQVITEGHIKNFAFRRSEGSNGRLPVASVAPMQSNPNVLHESRDSICSATIYNCIQQNTVRKNSSKNKNEPIFNVESGSTYNTSKQGGNKDTKLGEATPNPLEGIKLPYPSISSAMVIQVKSQSIKETSSNYNLPLHVIEPCQSTTTTSNSQLSLACSKGFESLNSGEFYESQQVEQLQVELQQSSERNTQLANQLGNKDAEIEQLRNTISQLQIDMQHLKSLKDGSRHRPPRSTSCRGIPDKADQLATSNAKSSSLTRVEANSSQEAIQKCSSKEDENRQSKRYKWKPALGKAFKKRSRSSVPPGDRDSIVDDLSRAGSPMTATVFTNPHGSRTTLSSAVSSEDPIPSLNAELDQPLLHSQTQLIEMRLEIQKLECDNQRLRQLLMDSGGFECPQKSQEKTAMNILSVKDILSRHCSDCKQIAHILVKPNDATVSTHASNTPSTISKHIRLLSKPIALGVIGVPDGISWEELDTEIITAFERYIKFLDPNHHIGLQNLAVEEYYLSLDPPEPSIKELRRKRCKETTNSGASFVLDSVDFIGSTPTKWIATTLASSSAKQNRLLIYLSLTEYQHELAECESVGSLGSLALDTLISVRKLKEYSMVVRSSWFTVLCGPAETGKLQLLRGFSQLLGSGPTMSSNIISVRPNAAPVLDGILSHVVQSSNTNGPRQVIILDGVHHISDSLHELVKKIRGIDASSRPIILATSDVMTKELESLRQERLIQVLEHLNGVDMSYEFLSNYLRRKLLQSLLTRDFKDIRSEELEILTKVICWLPKVWKHLSVLSHSEDTWQCSTLFGLRMFLTCPISVDGSEKWFADLWKDLFIPFLVRAQSVDKQRSTSGDRSVSVEWITATWPWSRVSPHQDVERSKQRQNMRTTENINHCNNERSLVTFGVTTNDRVESRTKSIKNRSSMDSGIVPDGFPAIYIGTTTNSCFENRSSMGSEGCD